MRAESIPRAMFAVLLYGATVMSVPFLLLGAWALPFVVLEFSAADYWALFVDPATFSVGEQTPYALLPGLYGIWVIWFVHLRRRRKCRVPRQAFVYFGFLSGFFAAQHMARYVWAESDVLLATVVTGWTACGLYYMAAFLSDSRGSQ